MSVQEYLLDVITVAPVGNTSFLCSCMQMRVMGKCKGKKKPISFISVPVKTADI